MEPEGVVGREDPWLTSMVPGESLSAPSHWGSLPEARHTGRIKVWKRELRVCVCRPTLAGMAVAEADKRCYNIGGAKGHCAAPALGRTSGTSVCTALSKGALWAVLLLETSLQASPLLCL